MPRKNEVIEYLNKYTERTSNRVWTISLGVLATCFAFIIESSKGTGIPFLEPRQVAGPASLAMAALVFDLLQYIFATKQNAILLKKMETDRVDYLKYDESSWAYIARATSFQVKTIACISAAIWLTFAATLRFLELI